MTLNTRSQKAVRGIATFGTYGSGTDKEKVQSLINLIEAEATQTHRGHLDQISPVARIQLLAELQALYTGVS